MSAKSKQKEIEASNEVFNLAKAKLGSVTPHSDLEKMTTMEDVSANRLSQINNSSFNACDKIYLPISFLRFKTIDDGNELGIPEGGLEVRIS
jgi:hypothetical protein